MDGLFQAWIQGKRDPCYLLQEHNGSFQVATTNKAGENASPTIMVQAIRIASALPEGMGEHYSFISEESGVTLRVSCDVFWHGEVRYLLINIANITSEVKREKELEDLAYRDELTDLPNRRAYYERFQSMLEEARKSGKGFLVALCDIDDLKGINDGENGGHDKGDEAICDIGRKLVENVRKGDTVSRLGGDEFALLFPCITTKQAGIDIVTRMMKRINGNFGHATVSMGISYFPEDGSSIDALIKAADFSLYEAKRAGKGGFRYAGAERQQERKKNRGNGIPSIL